MPRGAWLVIASTILRAQSIAPDELRVTNGIYVPPSPYTLHVETKLVQAGVVVRDSHGQFVRGLTRNDFQVFDAGKKREISTFSVEEKPAYAVRAGSSAATSPAAADNRPASDAAPLRFVALFFDDVNSSAIEIGNARNAALRFVGEGLAPGDRAAVFTASSLQSNPFTSDVSELKAAIGKITTHQRQMTASICPRMTTYNAYLIANDLDLTVLRAVVDEYISCNIDPKRKKKPVGSDPIPSDMDPDVIAVRQLAESVWDNFRLVSENTLDSIRGVVDHMGTMPGTRVILLASSGFLSGTLEEEQNKIINRALRYNVVINSLDAKGLFAEQMDPQGGAIINSTIRARNMEQAQGLKSLNVANDALATMAEGTGGVFFHNKNDLARGFRELAATPELTYMLGFAPTDKPDDKFHKLKVQLTSKRPYEIHARLGYFAAKTPDAPAADPQRNIDRQILNTDPASGVPASLGTEKGEGRNGAAGIWVIVHIDLAHLEFRTISERRTQTLTFVAALLDVQGNFVAGREGRIDLALKDTTFTQLSDAGINARLLIEAPPGKYRLRSVVEEAYKGQISAYNQEITLVK